MEGKVELKREDLTINPVVLDMKDEVQTIEDTTQDTLLTNEINATLEMPFKKLTEAELLLDINNQLSKLPKQSQFSYQNVLKNHNVETLELFYKKILKAINFELAYRAIEKKTMDEISDSDVNSLSECLGEQSKEVWANILKNYSWDSIFSKQKATSDIWEGILKAHIENLTTMEGAYEAFECVQFETILLFKLNMYKINGLSNTSINDDIPNSYNKRVYQPTLTQTNNPKYYHISSQPNPEPSKGEHFLWSALKALFWAGLGAAVGLIVYFTAPAVVVVPAGMLLVGWFAGVGFSLSALKSGWTNLVEESGWFKSFFFWNASGGTLGAVIGGIAGTFIPVPGIGTFYGALIGAAVGGFVAGVTHALIEKFIEWRSSQPHEEPVITDAFMPKKQMSKLQSERNCKPTSQININNEEDTYSQPIFAANPSNVETVQESLLRFRK